MLFVFMLFVSVKFSCHNIHSTYLYANNNQTNIKLNPNIFMVICIFIFCCEKIVFMIQIRTYISKILVIIGPINFKMR